MTLALQRTHTGRDFGEGTGQVACDFHLASACSDKTLPQHGTGSRFEPNPSQRMRRVSLAQNAGLLSDHCASSRW